MGRKEETKYVSYFKGRGKDIDTFKKLLEKEKHNMMTNDQNRKWMHDFKAKRNFVVADRKKKGSKKENLENNKKKINMIKNMK